MKRPLVHTDQPVVMKHTGLEATNGKESKNIMEHLMNGGYRQYPAVHLTLLLPLLMTGALMRHHFSKSQDFLYLPISRVFVVGEQGPQIERLRLINQWSVSNQSPVAKGLGLLIGFYRQTQ